MRTNAEFQAIVNAWKEPKEIVKLYWAFIWEELKEFFASETTGNAVKECADVRIVCQPVIQHGGWLKRNLARLTACGVSAWVKFDYDLTDEDLERAELVVTESNFSKFILVSELDEAFDHFKELGIEVEIDWVACDVFSAESKLDQTVSGKFYKQDKVLKGPKYKAVNEETQFWIKPTLDQ